MKRLYVTDDRVKLYLLKSKLEDHGIKCNIKNENPPLAGEIPSIVAWPELWVLDDERFHDAQNILKVDDIADRVSNEGWQCSQCAEYLEAAFNVCWKCGNSR